ncbi:MAG: T9SS C-terminal target domain-containing protein, partial [Bacteroidetes bacterium]
FDNHSYVWVVTGVGTLQNSNLNNATILWADTGAASIKVTAFNAECGSDTFTQAVQVAPAVGLTDVNGLSNLTLYPNPTVGEVFVTGNTTQKQVLVQVFNSTLQLVYHQTVEAAQGNINTSFNTTHLSEGLYFVKVGNDNNYRVVKLVVIR